MKRITSAEAKALNENFVKTRGKAIDREIGKKDAISSWFSIEELEKFIEDVKKEGTTKGKTVNGLRIYFGAYKKKNLSTVFIVPTEAKVGATQKDGITSEADSSDITDIDALNYGQTGNPPEAEYPQGNN
jgi:hypothetical protein